MSNIIVGDRVKIVSTFTPFLEFSIGRKGTVILSEKHGGCKVKIDMTDEELHNRRLSQKTWWYSPNEVKKISKKALVYRRRSNE